MRTAILSLITAAVMTVGAAHRAEAEIAWESSLRKAHTRASQEGKLILLHFIRDNCVYCDKLEAGAFQAANVNQTIAGGFVPLKINVSDSKGNAKLAEMFKVDRFPMDVVVTTDGKALAHGVSPQDPSKYIAMLASTLPPGNNRPAGVPAGQQIAAKQAPAQPAQSRATQTQPGQMPERVAAPSYAAAPTQPAAQKPAPAKPAATQVAATQPPVSKKPAKPVQTSPNEWAMPSAAKAAKNRLVSATQEDGLTLSMPEQVTDNAPAAASPAKESAAKLAADEPKLAMDGYCAVSVVQEGSWIEGSPKFGVVHLGKLYLFASKTAMDTFLADPIPYTPVLNEIDVVRFFEERKVVPGKREWAIQVSDRMFFFADEDAMVHFEQEHARYVDAAIEVMDKAIDESNPDS